MITICSVKDFEKYKSKTNILVARKKMYPISGVYHIPDLGPSLELLYWALEHRETDPNWFEYYTEKFNEYMLTPHFRYSVGLIREYLTEGDVTIMCYCTSKDCHRYLVGRYLESKGFQVKYV